VPKLSENIRVVSIVDRFLEHSRILYFHHGGEPLVLFPAPIGWPRNLDRRVELLVPVIDRRPGPVIAILRTAFQDNVKARQLMSDGRHERLHPSGDARAVHSQRVFFEQAAKPQTGQQDRYQTFVPQRPVAPTSTG